ncbi:MAG: hypothetical protein J6W41_02345 [Alphaproteobacteria bacterium]|nr:hypothetical protein [Alphaproteobacteria bacterium]
MKFIFSFLFSFIFLSSAFADNICTTLITDATQCNTAGGCIWDNLEPCRQCSAGTYNDGTFTDDCHTCPTGFDSGWATQNKAHPDGASSCDDFICINGYVKSNDGQSCVLNCSGITEPKFLPDGETNCDNWQCRAGYYRGGTDNNECKTCPSNSDNCTTNGGNYGLTTATVTCESGYIKSVSNGVVTCSTCPEHAEQSGNSCICTTGYYGDGNTCTACPYGTTSMAGSTAKSACHMTQNTKFCDATGKNCMKLLSGQNQNSINQ